ncbi:MAG TPA: hypothetical protein VHB77_09890, partial [Planctomycetaceae bacterium]|nr:hypothetical protein [Planctomycetaceae bacterium]
CSLQDETERPVDSCEPGLLEWLRGQDNPFDVYVQARRADGAFRRGHIPEINKSIADRLRGAIERYRLNGAAADQEPPRSGVAVILGKRGAGKTHLVHALQLPGVEAVVVAPSYFEPQRPFTEYLLQQLVRQLQDEADGDRRGTLALLADWFARRVAVQALYGLTDTEWLSLQLPRGSKFWFSLHGWGVRSQVQDRELLIQSLEQPQLPTLIEACRHREQDPALVRQISLRHIAGTEGGSSIRSQIRRGLYCALIATAFEGTCDGLFEFLLDGYTQVEAQTAPFRETLVEELFRALVELFLLWGHPVLYAFDALETLFGNPPEERRCVAFFQGLADLLDAQRGVPFVLLAESGHWEQTHRYLSSYAAQRLQQGVPSRGYGSVTQIVLPPISLSELDRLVAARMRPVLQGFYPESIPEHGRLGPIRPEDLAFALHDPQDPRPLRQILQVLRDRYEQLVYGRDGQPAAAIVPAVPQPARQTVPTELLLEHWRREQRAAERKIEDTGISGCSDLIRVGAEQWLQALVREGASIDGWRIREAGGDAFGNNPAYGHLIRMVWEKDGDKRKLGLAFFVSKGAAMPRDLETKLQMAGDRRLVDRLLILWPRSPATSAPAFEQLPGATRAIWDQNVTGELAARVKLNLMQPDDAAQWLALEAWWRAIRELMPDISDEIASHFVADQMQDLVRLIDPRSSILEGAGV